MIAAAEKTLSFHPSLYGNSPMSNGAYPLSIT